MSRGAAGATPGEPLPEAAGSSPGYRHSGRMSWRERSADTAPRRRVAWSNVHFPSQQLGVDGDNPSPAPHQQEDLDEMDGVCLCRALVMRASMEEPEG